MPAGEAGLLDPALEPAAGLASPAAPADDDEGRCASRRRLRPPLHFRKPMRLDVRVVARHVGDRRLREQRILGRASTTGPGRPAMAVWKAWLTYSGMRSTRSICADPFRHRAVHPPVVDLLERFALDDTRCRPAR